MKRAQWRFLPAEVAAKHDLDLAAAFPPCSQVVRRVFLEWTARNGNAHPRECGVGLFQVEFDVDGLLTAIDGRLGFAGDPAEQGAARGGRLALVVGRETELQANQ